MRPLVLGVLLWAWLTVPSKGGPLPYTVTTNCFILSTPNGQPGVSCDEFPANQLPPKETNYTITGGDGGYTVGVIFHAATSSGSYYEVFLSGTLDYTVLTPGPIRQGFADVTVDASVGNGEGPVVTFGGLTLCSFQRECNVDETLPITLGVPFTFSLQLRVPAYFADVPTYSDSNARLEITAIRDASGNAVPIGTATIPEPSQFGPSGIAFLFGALALTRQRKVTRRAVGPSAYFS